MSYLDQVILAVIFVMLALMAARDAREQTEARHLTELSCAWTMPGKTTSSVTRSAGRVCLKFLDVMFSVAIPCLIPCALLMLLTVQGCTSTDIILNGLSVGFVLELDNAVADTFLDTETKEAIEVYFREVGTRRLEAGDKLPVRRRFEVEARFCVIIFAFLAGIRRIGLPGSMISCEMSFCACNASQSPISRLASPS